MPEVNVGSAAFRTSVGLLIRDALTCVIKYRPVLLIRQRLLLLLGTRCRSMGTGQEVAARPAIPVRVRLLH